MTMPMFTALTNEGHEIAAVIALDDDQAREMITDQFKAEERIKTFQAWKDSGYHLVLDDKDCGEFEIPRSLF
jgi:hypothetical protein